MVSAMIFDYEYFKREVLTLTGINLSCYKEAQMKRRIDNLISKYRIEGYDKYVARLRTEPKMFEEFINHITINVSEFYRDPPQWKMMEDSVIPALIRKFGKNLKVWSAACSTGDEPYSLVLAMSRHLPLSNIRIHDVYPMGCHLIVCRNVLIYFTEEAKDVVFQKYFRSLANGGVLFIGSAEQIMNFRDIGFEKKHSLYYQKP